MNEEIYQEILKWGGGLKQRMEGDISYEMIMEALNVSYYQALKIGKKMILSGEYEKVQVMGDSRRLTMLRKVGNTETLKKAEDTENLQTPV